MDNYIQTLNADLARMKELMRSLLPTPSCFDDFLSLYILYKEYNNTNPIIDYAKAVINSGEGIDQLLADAKVLKEKVEEGYQLYLDNQQAFDSIDSKSLFKAHIKPFQDAEQAEINIATPLWKEYQHLSNRLDYIPMDSDEFKTKDEQCDAVKAEYDIHHAKVNELHSAYDNEAKRCSGALIFSLEDLSIVFYYMKGIAQSIIDTITKAKGE